nr:hypothetical protein [Tanacetum cinerariifolium]
MDITIDQQVALDKALVPHAGRLRIGRSNFRLLSDISSKESTLQLVYDVLRLTPFFKAFLVTIDVPDIYMQEFWATATVHHHSIRFKMDNKKHIVNLESFREMLHICPRLPGQTFDEPPFEEEILAFLRILKHSGAIKRLTDVKHKDTKKSNEMYYPRFTKVIIHHFMSKELSIPKRNKVNWHYVRDDRMFITIKLEYYAVATGATPPKTKASVWKTKSSSDTTVTPPLTTAAGTRLFTSTKGKQPATTSKVKRYDGDDDQEENDDDDAQDDDADEENANKDDDDDEGDDDDDQEEGSDDEQASDEEGKEFIHPSLRTHDEEEIRDEESFDPIPKTPENTDDEGNGEENLRINVGRKEGQDEEDEEDELYRDVNINLGRGVQMADVHTTQEFKDSHVTLTPFAGAVSSIPGIVQRYIDQQMNEVVKVAIQIQSDRLRDEAQAENEEFLKTIDENKQKIIKEQVKERLKISYAIAVDLSEMELKKILIEKMEGNKSIHRSNEQINLYKALVEAYESDKIILDTYGDTVTLKRHRDDDEDKDEEPSAGSNRGSKRRREGKEPESASAPKDKATRSTGKSTQGSKSRQTSASESATLKVDTLTSKLLAGLTYELMKGSCKSLVELEFFLEEVYKATTDQLDWVNLEGHQYPHNLLKPLPLIPNSRGRRVDPFDHFINNDLEYLRGGASSRKYTTSITKTKAADYEHIKWIEDVVPSDNVDSRTSRLRQITVRKDDDKLYKFMEGDFKRLCIQDIEDMLLLLHHNPKAYGRPSTRCQKLLEEAQPNKAGYNKDKQKWLMRIDELHKFNDGTLSDVRTALDDRLKGIRMKYLPQTI